MEWLDVAIDTETTGLSPDYCGIVQVGISWRDPDGGEMRRLQWDCNPGERFVRDAQEGALRVNGFTRDRIRRCAPAAEVAGLLRRQLQRLERRHGPVRLLAYNNKFDRSFLDCAPWQLLHEWGPCVRQTAKKFLDVHGLAGTLGGIEQPPQNYDELVSLAHSAAADAEMALHLWEHVIELRRLNRR